MTPVQELVVLPLCYFPPIGWWVRAVNAKRVLLDPFEFNIKQSYRNRCKIYAANGVQTLTVVTDNSGSKTPVNETTLVHYEPWRKIHVKALESAYYSSPYFEFFIDDIKHILESNQDNLAELNLQSINLINHILELDLNFEISTDFKPVYENAFDMRPGKKNEFYTPDIWNEYNQVFMDKGKQFEPNLSILDLLFNHGMEARLYLNSI